MKIIRSKNGFTLIESLVTILLLSIVLVGGMQLYINANRILALSKHKNMAMEIANSKLEFLKTENFLDIKGDNLNAENPKVVGGMTFQKNYTVVNQDNTGDTIVDFKSVNMSVSWREAWMNEDTSYQFLAGYANP